MILNAILALSNNKTQLFRSIAARFMQQKANYGKNGHFDVIIVGGGAAGISLAGSIGKLLRNNSYLLFVVLPISLFWQENRQYCKIKKSSC